MKDSTIERSVRRQHAPSVADRASARIATADGRARKSHEMQGVGSSPMKADATRIAAIRKTTYTKRVLHDIPHLREEELDRTAYFLGEKAPAELDKDTNPDKTYAARDYLRNAVAALK